jgi:hypothetical protein
MIGGVERECKSMSRLKTLAIVAGFLLIVKTPAFAQAPAESSAVAPNAQDESQTEADIYENQALTESDWWAENEGLEFGYLPGGYGLGLGSCGSRSQPGQNSAWWNAAGTNVWFPAGQQLPYPYGTGWCGNNGFGNRSGYALCVYQIVIPTNRHRRPTWKHNPGIKKNNLTQAQTTARTQVAIAKVPRELDRHGGGPDDDWTRVQDSTQVRDHIDSPHIQPTAALEQGWRERGTRLPQYGGRAKLSRPQQAHEPRMQGLARAHLTSSRVFAPAHMGGMHISGVRPGAHIAARSGGGRGHS